LNITKGFRQAPFGLRTKNTRHKQNAAPHKAPHIEVDSKLQLINVRSKYESVYSANLGSSDMVRFLTAFAFLVLMTLPMRAEALSADDQSAIQKSIETQLNAFAGDDFITAYAQAAPIVKMAFPTTEQFMTMVKKGYTPVYRNTQRNFGQIFEDQAGRPTMRVVLTAEDGKRYEAIYSMQKQEDGTWKIAGCSLILIPGLDV
jgi:Domain of unknown function (DUF4864)